MDKSRKQDAGRWKRGLLLAMIAAVGWGALPITLKLTLGGLDPYTITWYRLIVATLFLGAALKLAGGLPNLKGRSQGVWAMLAVAFIGLTANYILYIEGLSHTTPGVAQIVIQLGPMLFLLCGPLVFKERFSVWQWVGFAVLMTGMLLYFNRRLPELLNVSAGTGLGVALIVLAALLWVAYGLAQKQLTEKFEPQQILLLIYSGAVVVLFPAARLGDIRNVNALEAWMLILSCANTLVSYGAFAEALKRWEVSRVGAVVSLAPLFTFAWEWLAAKLSPGLLPSEGLTILSALGALLVVGGSTVCALASES